ncbi:uncharacterized protein DDB_G0284459-like isoform X2 [Paramacrobiotus metropolitanus]|uniref:uncharacterized protein DDB_G0284459-like isoform X2 n=1 Tax=Paramacrobiotus metropolitanus TaxID=2943436 RepID=UPI0024457374|nr:uncharacterized protein DDB_G0284459-like isoform X2 [Paramacrobiotus metropolitanus]
MNAPRRFTSRRVHNLRDLTSASGLSSLKSGNSYKRKLVDNNRDFIDDEAESDPELQTLRLAVFASKRQEPSHPAGSSRSRDHPDSSSLKNTRDSSSDHRAYSDRKHSDSLASPDKGYSKSPKLEDLDIEDLKRRIRTKKRSRYGRRNDSDSDQSSSEDDYYDYAKSRRTESSDLPTGRAKPNFSPPKNGNDTSILSLQRQTSNNSIHGRVSRAERQNSSSSSSKPSAGSTNNTTIVTKPMEEEPPAPTVNDTAMMERRRQKFQSGVGPVNPEEKSKVSLASLKSNPSSSLSSAKEAEKTASD